VLDWEPPARSAGDLNSLCFRSAFTGANHNAFFSPWRTIGWFNTMTTGKAIVAAFVGLIG
jgi:hypothetical protein